MQKFDPQAAMSGAKVCTRDGRYARILCFDLRNPDYPIAAAIVRDDGVEYCGSYTIYGSVNAHNIYDENPCDLMMADDDYLEKLERGGYGTPTAADPWDEFRREAALEMLRQRGGFCGDIASRIIEDVNRLTEGLIQGKNVNSMNSDE